MLESLSSHGKEELYKAGVLRTKAKCEGLSAQAERLFNIMPNYSDMAGSIGHRNKSFVVL